MTSVADIFSVPQGERKDFVLDDLHIHKVSEIRIPITVMRGKEDGPTLLLIAGIHGDELNGVSIVHKIIDGIDPQDIKGTLICMPAANVWGVLDNSRYMIDGRDLNRRFPGSETGSFTARTAYTIFSIAQRCDYCIDFHTGSGGRRNVPQVRANAQVSELKDMAKAFGVPIIYNNTGLEGSLRNELSKIGVKTILFEGGENSRNDRTIIRSGVNGSKNVMAWLGMTNWPQSVPPYSVIVDEAQWVRSPSGGILDFLKTPGSFVAKGETFVEVDDIFGTTTQGITLDYDGLIIGVTKRPLVLEGFPIAHVLNLSDLDEETKGRIRKL